MSARDHLNPRLFDPGPALSAEEQDRAAHQRMGRELAAFGQIAVSTPRDAVESVLRSGALKTQHETGRSEGAFNPSLRRDVEQRMGYDDLPVYGALQRSPAEEPHYGNVNFHLKPEVKRRSTMFPGDSLNEYRPAARSRRGGFNFNPLVDEDPLISGASQASTAAIAEGKASPIVPEDWDSSYADERYVEAHVHQDPARRETRGLRGAMPDAGVPPAARVPLTDVSKVAVHEGSLRFDPFAETRDAQRPRNYEVGQQLRQAGLPVEHVLTDVLEQPVLPMSYGKDLPPPGWHGTRKRVVRHENLAGRDRWGSD